MLTVQHQEIRCDVVAPASDIPSCTEGIVSSLAIIVCGIRPGDLNAYSEVVRRLLSRRARFPECRAVHYWMLAT